MARLSSEFQQSLGENNASQKAAPEALDARLKEEIDCIITYRGDELARRPCGSNLQEGLSMLEARVGDIDAALAEHGQYATSQAAGLEALDVLLRDEIQRVSLRPSRARTASES